MPASRSRAAPDGRQSVLAPRPHGCQSLVRSLAAPVGQHDRGQHAMGERPADRARDVFWSIPTTASSPRMEKIRACDCQKPSRCAKERPRRSGAEVAARRIQSRFIAGKRRHFFSSFALPCGEFGLAADCSCRSAIPTGGRLLRSLPALPGRGRLTSVLVVLRPALRILIGRLLLRRVAALAGGGLASARVAGPHVLVARAAVAWRCRPGRWSTRGFHFGYPAARTHSTPPVR